MLSNSIVEINVGLLQTKQNICYIISKLSISEIILNVLTHFKHILCLQPNSKLSFQLYKQLSHNTSSLYSIYLFLLDSLLD